MKKSSHITLEDIAKRLKVSRVTVSKALRGHPDISEETSKKVHEIAAQLGYSPNIIARNLSARRSNMLGLVVPKIAHFFFSSVIEAVYNTAFLSNYETVLTVSQENAEREKKHLQTLVSMRVDGIIISISQETRDLEVFKWIQKIGIPLLFMDRRPEPLPPGFNSLLVDDRSGAFQAVQQAVKVGYRKIAFVGGNTHINIGKNRLLGFKDALNAHGLPIDRDLIIQGGYGKEDGYNGLKTLHRNGKLPEFIFTATYPVALGVYEAAKELGLNIPNDIDMICFGDSDVGRFISPSLSCVSQPTHELGTRSVQMILEEIRHPETYKDQHVEIPTELILRETGIGRRTMTPGTKKVSGTSLVS